MDSRKYGILVVILLTAATAASHGGSLGDGLFFDDHWHRLGLQHDDWSFQALLDATTIKPDRFIDEWWRERSTRWQYFRPFSVLVAKAVYHLSGGSVKALHALSIVLHLIGALLVHHLCLRLTHRRFWSVVGALLFVVYSHSVFGVAWLAAQNSVLQTVLMLAALLCYARASGLDLYAGRARGPESGRRWSDGEKERRRAGEAGADGQREPLYLSISPSLHLLHDPAPLGRGLFCCAVVLWGLALASRENAIVLPVFAAACDLAFGGWRHVRARVPAYALLVGIAVAFAAWRLTLHYHPMPDFYVRRPDGPGYLLWCVAKLMHYLTAAVWLSPLMFGPTIRYDPFRESPGDCLLMFAILAVMATGYVLACRRARGWWIWPMWILLAVLPVVPVMATPHSGYMPAVGFAVAMALGPALRDRIRPVSIGRWSPVVAIWFLIATTIYMPIYRPMWRSVLAAERLTVARVVASPPPPEAKELFFINLPFVNVYIQFHLKESWEESAIRNPQSAIENFRCHVLTYASNVLRMEQPCRIEQLDAHSFSLSVTGRPYFSGAMGRYLIESSRPSGVFRGGQVIPHDPFDVEVAEANEEGVRRLVFRFREPLVSPRYCFYVTTNRCAAARVKFWGPEFPRAPADTPLASPGLSEVGEAARRLTAGDAEAADVLLAGIGSEDEQVRSAARAAFGPVARPVAEALAAPVQDILAQPDPSREDWHAVRRWWRASVDDEVLHSLWLRRADLDPLRRTRDVLFRIRGIAARVIQTDLYLTDERPFPDPR